MDFSWIIVALAVLTLVMAGANNAGNSAGTIAGSRILSYEKGIVIFVAGLALGALLEGDKLTGAIQGGAVKGTFGTISVEIVLFIALMTIAIATLAKLPLPISQAIFGASIGCGLFLGLPLNIGFIVLVIASWGGAPFVAAFISLVITKLLKRKPVKGLDATVVLFGLLTLGAGFYTAYTFGANTLGLFIGIIEGSLGWPVSITLTVVATGLGALLLGQRVTKTVGEGIASLSPPLAFASQLGGALTVHIFTQGGIPVSISESITGGIVGSGLGRGVSAVSRQTILRLVALSVATPTLSVAAAWMLQALL